MLKGQRYVPACTLVPSPSSSLWLLALGPSEAALWSARR